MASHTGLSDAGPSNHHHLPYSLLHGINNPNNFINQEGSAFNFGELEEAIVLQGVKIGNDESIAKQALFTGTGRPSTTLDMFPSWPLRFQHNPPPRGNSISGGESTEDSESGANTTISSKAEEPDSPMSNKMASAELHHHHMASGSSLQSAPKPSSQDKRKAGSTSEKPFDAKTLRRLAQNREAARKSRLRKKAYVQQLESSRIRLSQLEQDLQRARSQGLFLGGCGGAAGNISPGAAIFDVEYARWLEDDQRHMSELRAAIQAHLPDGDLRIIVDGYIAHYDEIFKLKGLAAKTDVFHLITGMWTSPAERCFLWMGGFRPSELIKMLITQLDPLTEQQFMGICSLQHSSQQAEEALSQGLDQLQQSLVDTIATGPTMDAMQQMAIALGKLANLEGFVRQMLIRPSDEDLTLPITLDHQADNLRQQTLHQLRRILTVRQAARCFLVIGEYYGRLRALSSLWASRPREAAMMINDDTSCQTTDLQMVQAVQNHFGTF